MGLAVMRQTTRKDLAMDSEWIDADGGFDRLRLTDDGMDFDRYGEPLPYLFGLTPEIAEKIRDGLTSWIERKTPPAIVKLPIEWATERGYVITDADGWRGQSGRRFDEPVYEGEFVRRSSSCTLAPLSSLSGQVLFKAALEQSDLGPAKAANLRALALTYRPDADAELAAFAKADQ